jgi:hypothetical protein
VFLRLISIEGFPRALHPFLPGRALPPATVSHSVLHIRLCGFQTRYAASLQTHHQGAYVWAGHASDSGNDSSYHQLAPYPFDLCCLSQTHV